MNEMTTFRPHFNTVFWSQKQSGTALPDFQTGFNMLHQKLGQSRVENEEFISFLKDRIAIEELYATKLNDQGKIKNKSIGFERDDGTGLKRCFTKLKETSTHFGQHHNATATTLTNQVLNPLQECHEKYKQDIANSKQNMEMFLKQFDSLVKEAEKSKSVYHKRCKEADWAEELALKNATVAAAVPKAVTVKEEDIEKNDTTMHEPNLVQLGSVTLSQSEFDSLVRKMRERIPTGEHRVPLLGRYQNTSSGEDIAKWLQHHLPQCKDSPAMSDIVGQQLIQNHHILRLIGQRGNKFISSPNSFYQWRITEEDNVSITDSNSTGSHALGGFVDKITTTSSTTSSTNSSESGLEHHKKARREAEKADESYRINMKRLDQMRMTVEEAMFSHFTEMEQVELWRIKQVKQLISTFVVGLSSSIPKDKIEIEELMVYQESLKPDQEIQYIIQQCAISSFNPKAILYSNYYHGSAHDQVFGISLEELGKQGDNNVPRFISFILEAIQKGAEELNPDTRVKLWSTLCPLGHIYAVHSELNISSDSLKCEIFEEKDPILLAGVLRHLLLELPECLMTYEFYDLAETFFVGDEEILIPTLSSIIATLPDSHFFTLKTILENIASYVKKYSMAEYVVESICQSMGPAILRPRVESYTTITSRLPVKLFKKLLTFYDEIFSDTALKLHIESEKRRHAKPLVVTENDIQTLSEAANISNNKGSEKEYRKNPKRSSLMSFIRPTSVMGVFQKNSTPNPTSPKPSTNRSVSLSFGSSITRSDSPPLSPKVQYSNDAPDNLQSLTSPSKTAAPVVMFDIDDAVFSNGFVFENNNKSDAILKEIDIDNNYAENGAQYNLDTNARKQFKNEHIDDTQITSLEVKEEIIDSSFFDDDDDD